MILLKRDNTNTVVVTLQEKTTITAVTPSYLFEITNDNTNESKLFTAPDTSTNIRRYNQFDITVSGGTEDLLNGTIDINNNGFWEYKIYEQESATNLDISGTTSVVETGKLYLSGSSLPITTEYISSGTTNFVYTGE